MDVRVCCDVCVCVLVGDCMHVYVWVSEREGEFLCVCACVCVREREREDLKLSHISKYWGRGIGYQTFGEGKYDWKFH